MRKTFTGATDLRRLTPREKSRIELSAPFKTEKFRNLSIEVGYSSSDSIFYLIEIDCRLCCRIVPTSKGGVEKGVFWEGITYEKSMGCKGVYGESVIDVDMAVDGNRDNEIKFDDPEDASEVFWVNDDSDVVNDGEEDDGVGLANDCDDDTINVRRDLEDFSRLHIKIDSSLTNISNVKYYLQFKNYTGFPKINLFEAVYSDLDYLNGHEQMDYTDADMLMQKTKIMTIDNIEREVPTGMLNAGNNYFVYEGKSEGKGQLPLIVKIDNKVILENNIDLDLFNCVFFYKYYYTQIESGDTVEKSYRDGHAQMYTPESDELLVLVHGWNMTAADKVLWADTTFKRLYWQGYKGQFVMFSWPTLELGFNADLTPWNYDRSEFRAWQSAQVLADLLEYLSNIEGGRYRGKIRLIAHSMGNIVAGEALRIVTSNTVSHYVASQAAISSHMYDSSVPNAFTSPTPNVIAHYFSGATPDIPYLDSNRNRVSKMIRYFNPDDWALDWWIDNNIRKPDVSYHYTGNATLYQQGTDRFYYDSVFPYDERDLLFPNDRFEIFSFAARSYARAIGQYQGTVNGFQEEFDLRDFGYDGAHYSHSRQFRSNIIDEWAYWKKLMIDCGLGRN